MPEQTFREIEIKLLDVSNYGLDIIQELYPTATDRKNFRIRDYNDDKNESASMKLLDVRGVRAYRVTDFGGTVHSENCFGLYALANNCSYTEAVLELANDYQAKGHQILDTEKVIYKPEYRECAPELFEGKLNEKNFTFIIKDFTPFELGLLGPEIKGTDDKDNTNGNFRSHLITPEVCKEVNLYSLEEYSFLAKDESKVVTYRSTDKFPILAFINEDPEIGQWLKIYKPRAGKKYTDDGKDYRFHHVGGRPKNFIFGQNRLRDLLEDYRDENYDDNSDIAREDMKLPRITIATGGSDGLNLLALGEPVIWFNSETEKITKYTLNNLKQLAEDIINIPDCDSTGKREGRDLALEFLEVRTLWLDNYFRNKNKKDFKDFAFENQHMTKKQMIRRVGEMMDATMPAKFWVSAYNEKSKRFSHIFSPMFSFYFLRLNGFCRILDRSRKDGYYFARVSGNVVEEVDVTDIKNYFKDFLIEKQRKEGVREVSYSLMDSLITTNRISESTIDRLHIRELDFSDFEQDAQYWFLGDRIFKTTKTGTTQAKFDRYVLKSQLLENLIVENDCMKINPKDFKVSEKPFFKIKETEVGKYTIDILEDKCDSLNYFIQTSRCHWQTEKSNMAEAGFDEAAFFEKSKFKITSSYLDTEHNERQMAHLVNKIYARGYLVHRYNDPSKPFAPFAIDDAVLEDNVAEGGSGKSIFFKGLKFYCTVFDINGKDNFKDDKFIYEGVSMHTDIIFVNDVERDFDMKLFYNVIEGDLKVNTKNEKKFKLPFKYVPKFCFTSNYSLRDQEGATVRRRIDVGFSDYYHAPNESRAKREPKDDFGHNLFTDWNQDQWFKDINFNWFCLQFYLGARNKINAPGDNIMKRKHISDMGVHFQEWADIYLPTIIGQEIIKDEVLTDCQNSVKDYAKRDIKTNKINPFLKDISSNIFKKKMNAWCKVNDYKFEDRLNRGIQQYDSLGHQVMKDGKPYKLSTEHIKISSLETSAEDEKSPYSK